MPLTRSEINRLRSLREKKRREALGLFVVEGEKVVGELLEAHFPWVELLVTERCRLVGLSSPVRVVSEEEMARISQYPTPSPAFGVGRLTRSQVVPGEFSLGRTLALDGVQDAGNVGTLLRLVDWFGFDRLVLSPDCADLYSQKVINASMGSFSRVRVVTAPLSEILDGVSPGVPILGCDLEGIEVSELPPMNPVVVVIGSEGRGLSPEVSVRVTRRVTIRRFGQAESLNAAVAAGIVCAQLRR